MFRLDTLSNNTHYILLENNKPLFRINKSNPINKVIEHLSTLGVNEVLVDDYRDVIIDDLKDKTITELWNLIMDLDEGYTYKLLARYTREELIDLYYKLKGVSINVR